MTELQRYLAEEVAEDHADGIITRREAMRRLGLLGLTGAAATGLLSRFAAQEADAAAAAAGDDDYDDGTSSAWAPVATQAITFAGPRGTLMAAWAPAAEPRGGVLVIHENRGLTDHIRQVAGRFAASGYSALALDLLSEEGGTGSFGGDDARIGAALSAASTIPGRFEADMRAGVTELRRRHPGKRLAAVGFCFGGGMVWRLLAAGEHRLRAAVPFYGPFPTSGDRDLTGGRAAVLGIYGGLDARVNGTREAARAALEEVGLEYHFATFSAADHAFFNDTGARFNAPAAAEAWHRTLEWFEEHLSRRRRRRRRRPH